MLRLTTWALMVVPLGEQLSEYEQCMVTNMDTVYVEMAVSIYNDARLMNESYDMMHLMKQ